MIDYIPNSFKEIAKKITVRNLDTFTIRRHFNAYCEHVDNDGITYIVILRESLKKDEKFGFCITFIQSNHIFKVKDDLDAYHHRQGIDLISQFKYSSRASLGLKNLIISIQFPKDYPILNPDYLVDYKNQNYKIKEKIAKKILKPLEEDKDSNKITLTVERPIVGLDYTISCQILSNVQLSYENGECN